MKNLNLVLLIIAGLSLIIQSCYYDNQQEIHPSNTASCDTTAITYANQIKTIIQTQCPNCHSGTSPSGGINLDTYEGVKTVVANGRLYGAINYTSGFRPMPPTQKMSDCEINSIKIWMDAGALNN